MLKSVSTKSRHQAYPPSIGLRYTIIRKTGQKEPLYIITATKIIHQAHSAKRRQFQQTDDESLLRLRGRITSDKTKEGEGEVV